MSIGEKNAMKKLVISLSLLAVISLGSMFFWNGISRSGRTPVEPEASQDASRPTVTEKELPDSAPPLSSPASEASWEEVPDPADSRETDDEESAALWPEDGSVTRVALSLESGGGPFGRRQYSDPLQIVQLLGMLPDDPDSALDEYAPPSANAVLVEITAGEDTKTYRCYSDDTLEADGDDPIWLSANPGTYAALRDATDWNPNSFPQVSGNILFRGDRVTTVYVYNKGGRCCHNISAANGLADILARLETLEPEVLNEAGETGFLVVTGSASFSYPLSTGTTGNEARDSLAAEAVTLAGRYGRTIRWIAETPDFQVQSIRYSGRVGYGFSNHIYAPGQVYAVQLDTQSAATIAGILNYLRSVPVGQNPTISPLSAEPGGAANLYRLDITLRDGTQFRLSGYDSGLTIYAAHHGEEITYPVSTEQIRRLRDYMAQLPEATRSAV